MDISVSEHGHRQIWFNNWLYYNECSRQNGLWSFHLYLAAALKCPDIKGQLNQADKNLPTLSQVKYINK